MFCILTGWLSKAALNGSKVIGWAFFSAKLKKSLVDTEVLGRIVFFLFEWRYAHGVSTTVRLEWQQNFSVLFHSSQCSYTPLWLAAAPSSPPASDKLRMSQSGSLVWYPCKREGGFPQKTTHSNLNGESGASPKRASPSVYLLKLKIEISLGQTVFVPKGWIAGGATDPQPCLMHPGPVVM